MTTAMGRVFFFGATIFGAMLASRLLHILFFALVRIFRPTYETEKSLTAEAYALELIPYSVAVYILLNSFAIPQKFVFYTYGAWRSVLAFNITWIIYALITPAAMLFRRGHMDDENRVIIAWVVRITKFMILMIGFSTILEIWGVKVSTLIASVGIVGMAVALGAQDMFKNIIAGMTIIAESRFNVGDIVRAESGSQVVEGIIENIGFRSTRIIKFDRAPMYVPNNTLADAAVINITNRLYRRISTEIRLELRTAPAQVKYIRDEIENYILETSDFINPPEALLLVRADRFDDSGVVITIICFTNSNIFIEFMEAKEKLLLKVKEIVAKAGAELAMASRSIYIEKTDKSVKKRELPKALAAKSKKAANARQRRGGITLLPGEELV